MNAPRQYNTHLAMGLGLISETKTLLNVWSPEQSANQLYGAILSSGLLPGVSAYRLHNVVIRCFAGRYLVSEAMPAKALKRLVPVLQASELSQLLFLYTCRANPVLYDFVTGVYWNQYSAGAKAISKDVAETFIVRAIDDGKTPSRWAKGQIERLGRYLTGCCADFGLLEPQSSKLGKAIKLFRIEQTTTFFLSVDLHIAGFGDNAILSHPDWHLFGLSREEVLDEIKRLSLKGLLIVQTAGDVVRISWKHPDMEALCNVLAQG
jgi:hypothetical protein